MGPAPSSYEQCGSFSSSLHYGAHMEGFMWFGVTLAANFSGEGMPWESWALLNFVSSTLYSFLSSDFFIEQTKKNHIFVCVYSPILFHPSSFSTIIILGTLCHQPKRGQSFWGSFPVPLWSSLCLFSGSTFSVFSGEFYFLVSLLPHPHSDTCQTYFLGYKDWVWPWRCSGRQSCV